MNVYTSTPASAGMARRSLRTPKNTPHILLRAWSVQRNREHGDSGDGMAASTTQFCRQCHFGESNEANGGSIATQF